MSQKASKGRQKEYAAFKSVRLKEAIDIKKQDKPMNRDEGYYQLPHIYDNV